MRDGRMGESKAMLEHSRRFSVITDQSCLRRGRSQMLILKNIEMDPQ